MRFCLIASFLACPLPAQATGEAALREKVKVFFDALQAGKYRVAFALVADDSQDRFMAMDKAPFRAWKISSIETPAPDRAKVTLLLDSELTIAAQRVPMQRPIESTWKIEEGEWRWYQEAPTSRRTPFGVIPIAPTAPSGSSVDLKDKLAAAPSPTQITRGVTIEADTAIFQRSVKGSTPVRIVNNLPGWVAVEVEIPKIDGLRASARKIDVPPNGEMEIQILWEPGGDADPGARAQYRVSPSPVGDAKTFEVRWVD
jgi:hypothetical protein